MHIDRWKYYNHSVIPTTVPHEIPDIIPITDGSIWKIGGGGVLRYCQGGLEFANGRNSEERQWVN